MLVRGPLTLGTVGALLDTAAWRLQAPETRVDLSAVTEADSSAIGLLLAWVRAARASERRIRFENLPANLCSLIALYEVGEFVPGAS